MIGRHRQKDLQNCCHDFSVQASLSILREHFLLILVSHLRLAQTFSDPGQPISSHSAPFGAGRLLSAGALFSSGDARAALRFPALLLASRFCLLLELPLLSLSAGRLSICPVLFLLDISAAQCLQALELCITDAGLNWNPAA